MLPPTTTMLTHSPAYPSCPLPPYSCRGPLHFSCLNMPLSTDRFDGAGAGVGVGASLSFYAGAGAGAGPKEPAPAEEKKAPDL